MNWLAHLVLSEPTPEYRVGNVLADILPVSSLRAMPDPFQAGIARHRAIDSFTDKHPIFRRSVARLDAPFRRYGGVIVDIFYDHLLTAHWSEHSTTQLDRFVAQFHADVDMCRDSIPRDALAVMRRMRSDEWLTSYGDTDGVRLTLSRIARRLRRPFDLGGATKYLEHRREGFDADFGEFFPLIRSHFSANGGFKQGGIDTTTHPLP